MWLLSDGDLSLEVGTNVKYAKWVNDGHKANPDGVASRFIPGKWVGDRFIYDPNAKEGMGPSRRRPEGGGCPLLGGG